MAAYLFDAAITACGIVIDNALLERTYVSMGGETKSNPRYTLEQILAPHFFLPSPERASKPMDGLAALMMMAGKAGSGVKLWKAVEPS